MSNYSLTPGVLIIVGFALAITTVSLYVSRVYLPMKIKGAYLKSITTLAAAVETKESGTVGHAQRVAHLAVEMARRLSMAGRSLERIEYAALLMDIGKANVPQAVLKKSEELTSEEREIVRSHVRMGANMVAAVPFLADLESDILHHHEYWDGTGYPNGLNGENIPLGSRILSVASDYDAMISERPYHPRPLSHEEAIEEIRTGVGRKYDPDIAAVFLDMMSRTA